MGEVPAAAMNVSGTGTTGNTNYLDSILVLIYLCTGSCHLVELVVSMDTSSTDIYTVTIVKQYTIDVG